MAVKLLSNQSKDLSFQQSTYSGFQNNGDAASGSILDNNWIRLGLLGVGGFYANKWHRNQLENNPNYVAKIDKYLGMFEERTPYKMGRTLGLRDRWSSHLANGVSYSRGQLISEGGALSPIGSHFQRMFGDKYDIAKQMGDEGLSFTKNSKSSVFHSFDQAPEIDVRFVRAESQLAGTSNRLNRPTRDYNFNYDPRESFRENFHKLKRSQTPGIHPGAFDSSIKASGNGFLPFTAKFAAETEANSFQKAFTAASNLGARAQTESLFYAERGQKLLSEVGVGLGKASYNKAFTIPFLAKEGEKGYINELLLKRVLPVYVGFQALKYADYLTGHHVSNTLIDIPLKANLVRAELTDRLPGARAITDAYDRVTPGNQYGPLALPLGGAFLGGLYHYGKVLKGTYADDAARKLGARILPDLKALKNVKNLEGLKVGLQSVWKEGLGAPAKGALLGAVLALPFIPGMLGSRKNASELRDIYSGDQDVPIRSGRWWSLGSSPFSGGRITGWRPHWSQIYKSHAREKSLWGSEENAWAHNSLFHPFRFLKDPYALEERNYRSRPYPITSPAFTNVPLIGPLLAATIGKVIKPPKRMHEDEFDEREYDMYSTRLNPKGPIVESKFEKDVLQDLSRKGYKTQTQVKEGDYRIDFVVEGEKGKKLAIETDGDSYHGKWNAKSDAERQAYLEDKGWDVVRVHSTPYFEDPNKAMAEVYRQLNKRGISPDGNSDGDTRSGLIGLAPPVPKEEFGLFHALKDEVHIFADFIGLPGYIGITAYDKLFPDKTKGQDAYLQGSRQMDSLARSYYDLNVGEGLGPNLAEAGTFGYTEPLRRFIQRDRSGVQVNDIKNEMPSWMPNEDYLINFQQGDPYTKVEQGFARLPGAGYEALHPELEGLNPEDYPDINKLSILADVAPYSREFNMFKDRVGNNLPNEEARIQYEQILSQAQQTKDSILQVDKRRFTGETDSLSGTIKSATSRGVELSEFPGRVFKYSSLGMSGADLSAVILGQQNSLTRSEVANEVVNRQKLAQNYIANTLKPGQAVDLTVAKGAANNSETVSAVFEVNGTNINKELIDKGYAQYNERNGGAESGKIFGKLSNLLGSYAERLAYDVPDFVPTPYHTKLWQERTAYDQYISQEVVGTRMRRWDRPFDDFASPYTRGIINKLTGEKIMAETTVVRRDLDTLADQLKYLRGLHNIADGTGDKYTRDLRRTNIGTNLLASPIFVASTIPDRDKRYFQSFVGETDPDKRVEILKVVPPEMARTLQAQWAAADARIASASGKDPGIVQEQGRLVTQANLEEYSKAKTQLGYGDYLRSKEISGFFARTGLNLPESGDSDIFSDNLDYEDVKLKIIQNEGYDAHDFNIFDDRAAMLWRKPYVDGAVYALTSGDTSKSAEQIRRSVEQLMITANNKNASTSVINQASPVEKNNVKININVNEQDKLIKDIRRNPEDYQ